MKKQSFWDKWKLHFFAIGALLLTLLGLFVGSVIREEALSGASPAVIDPASAGFGGMNRSENLKNLTNNWRRYQNVTFTGTLKDGTDIEIVPWYKANHLCSMDNNGVSGFRICENPTGIFVSSNHTNQTFCQVTDEGSQVMLADALGSQNGTRMKNWVRTIQALNCGIPGNLTEWTTGLWYNQSGNHWVVDCDRVSNNDSASDADAHFITGLAVINNSNYANASTRQYAGDVLNAMCTGFYTYNFLQYNISSRINPGQNISSITCGGTDVCRSPDRGSITWMGYNGPILEALAACNAKIGDTASRNWTKTADNVIQLHLQASNWTGSVFTIGYGRQYHWANYTPSGGKPGMAYPVCDGNCLYMDDPDGMRAPRICHGAAVWRDHRNVTFRNITTYCQQWHNLAGETGTTHTIERYFDGSPRSSNSDGGYKAVGLGAFMNALVNTSLADNRIDQYNSHLSWSGTRGTMDSQACFGVYDKAFGMIALGFLIGAGDSAFTGNGTIGGDGGGGGNGSNGSGGSPNITIANQAINATSIAVNGVVKVNVSVNTTQGTIHTVYAEILYPSGIRQNLSMGRVVNVTEVAGAGNVTLPQLVANNTFTNSNNGWNLGVSGSTGWFNTSTGVLTYNGSSFGPGLWSPDYDLTNFSNGYNITLVFTSSNITNQKFHYSNPNGSFTGDKYNMERQNDTLQHFKHDSAGFSQTDDYAINVEQTIMVYVNFTANNTKACHVGGSCTGLENISGATTFQDLIGFNPGTYITTYSFNLSQVLVWNVGNGSGGNSTNVTSNTSYYELNFTNTSFSGSYQVTRIWANSTTGETGNKTVLLNFSTPGNSTNPITWASYLANTTQNHNLTYSARANATNQSNSSCMVAPQSYKTNNTALFNNTHRWNDGAFVNNSFINASGEYGSGLTLDGVGDYLTTPNASDLLIAQNITIMAWVRVSRLPTSANLSYRVLSKEDNNVSGYGLYLWSSDDSPRCALWGVSPEGALGASAGVPLNSWTHVACRYNSTNITTFVNCLPQADNTAAGTINMSSTSLFVGQQVNGSNDFNGSLDEVRLFGRALSDAEICAEMNSPTPIKDDKMVLSYSFTDYNSSAVFDTEHQTNTSPGYIDNRTGRIGFGPNISKTGFYRVVVNASDNCTNNITQTVNLNITNTRPNNGTGLISGTLVAGSTLSAICNVSDNDTDTLFINWTVRVNTSILQNGTTGPVNSGSIVAVYNFTSVVGNNYTVACRGNDTLLVGTAANVTVGPVLSAGNGTLNVSLCRNMTSVLWALNATYYNSTVKRIRAPNVSFYPVNNSLCNFTYNLTLNGSANVTQGLYAFSNYSISNSSLTCLNKTLNSSSQFMRNITSNSSVYVNCTIMLNDTYVFNVSMRNIAINWTVV